MKEFLFFQLYGPMASWGEVAMGEIRSTRFFPLRSAVLGLLAAAMGVRRKREDTLKQMSDSYRIAVLTRKRGSLLTDYHTVQTPTSTKKSKFYSRKSELAARNHELNTMLSTREYIVDALYYVAVLADEEKEAPFSLEELRKGLKEPGFVLYLGRKSCPPALPLHPEVLSGKSLEKAFDKYGIQKSSELMEPLLNPPWKQEKEESFDVYWEDGFVVEEKIKKVKDFNLRDDPLSRKRWQFKERKIYSGTFKPENKQSPPKERPGKDSEISNL